MKKKLINWSNEITLGEFLQVIFIIATIGIGIIQINKTVKVEITEVKRIIEGYFHKTLGIKYYENEVYFLDNNLSSFKITAIDKNNDNVSIQFNNRGEWNNLSIVTNKTEFINFASQKKYSFIVKKIDSKKKYAEIVVTEIK